MEYNYSTLGRMTNKNSTTVRNKVQTERFKKRFPQVTHYNIFVMGTSKVQQVILTIPNEILEDVLNFIKKRPSIADWELGEGKKVGRPRVNPKKTRNTKIGRPITRTDYWAAKKAKIDAQPKATDNNDNIILG